MFRRGFTIGAGWAVAITKAAVEVFGGITARTPAVFCAHFYKGSFILAAIISAFGGIINFYKAGGFIKTQI